MLQDVKTCFTIMLQSLYHFKTKNKNNRIIILKYRYKKDLFLYTKKYLNIFFEVKVFS